MAFRGKLDLEEGRRVWIISGFHKAIYVIGWIALIVWTFGVLSVVFEPEYGVY